MPLQGSSGSPIYPEVGALGEPSLSQLLAHCRMLPLSHACHCITILPSHSKTQDQWQFLTLPSFMLQFASENERPSTAANWGSS
jgi:hypothetical protein